MIIITSVIVSLLLFFARKEPLTNLKQQYLKHSTLALIGIIVVFFQFPIDYLLGNLSASNTFIWVNNKIVLKSLTLSVVGLLSFFLGYLVFKPSKINRGLVKVETPVNVSFLVLGAAILLALYFLTVNPLYLIGYYGHVQMGTLASGASSVFKILIFAAIIQRCRNLIILGDIPISFRIYCKKMGLPIILLLGIYLSSVLISGDRGPLVFYGVLFVAGYFFITKRKLSLKYAFLYIFIGAAFITLLGLARGLNKELSFSERISKSIYEADTSNELSFSPYTAELAKSMRTLNLAVDYVPENHGFFYGRFQFQTFAKTVPFLEWFYPLIFEENEERFSSSSSFLTWVRQGSNARFGDGTSCIADLYLDFGFIGVVLGMFLFGYWMRFAEVSMYSEKLPSLFITIFFMVYMSSILYIARSSIFEPIAKVCWIYFILIINRRVLKRAS